MEQDRKPRNKSMYLWPINLQHGSKIIQCRKDSFFNKWCWENQTVICKKMKSKHSLAPYRKISSKWIKGLNTRSDTIILLEEKQAEHSFTLIAATFFSDLSPRVMEIKAKINKWDLIKLKSFCTVKEIINKTKGSPQNGRKYLQMMQLTKDQSPKFINSS